MSRFSDLFKSEKPIIGMIHLPPLPDYDGSPGLSAIIDSALNDLKVLEAMGVDGALIENEYDQPHRVEATPETISAMTSVTRAVVEASDKCVIGVEILLNDPKASLDVAKAARAQFVRTDYFVDPMSRPQYGEFNINPEDVITHRHKIGADQILILADIQVKYAKMLIDRTMEQSASLAQKHLADAIVVSGHETGNAPVTDDLDAAKRGCTIPVIIGSGTDALNVTSLLSHCDGAIVGTALMKDKVVDIDKTKKLMSTLGRF